MKTVLHHKIMDANPEYLLVRRASHLLFFVCSVGGFLSAQRAPAPVSFVGGDKNA